MRGFHANSPRRVALLLSACLALGALAGRGQADILKDILARVPAQPRSFNAAMNHLQALGAHPHCRLSTIGQSHQGRPIVLAEVTDPTSPYIKATLFVMARQHGNEPTGTEATLALLEQLLEAPTALEQEILKFLRVVAVPVVNPDGMVSGRRANARGIDLNRDWGDLSQPETRAVDRAVQQIVPHAVVDLHDLPAQSSRPAYQQSFIQTTGISKWLPDELGQRTKKISTLLATWTRALGYPMNVYYDYPGQDARLAHRYFGLYQQFPTFLSETKSGGGRTLRDKAGFHAITLLVVANFIMHDLHRPEQMAVAPAENNPAPEQQVQAPPPAPALRPLELRVEFQAPAATEQERRGEIRTTVEGDGDFQYITLSVGGTMRALSNLRQNSFSLDLTSLPAGEHTVRVAVYDASDVELAAHDLNLRLTPEDVVLGR